MSDTRTRELDRAHVFHSWSAQDLIDPLPITSAQGSHFTDDTGKRYLDFSSQLVNINIGYQHPKLVAAIQEQAARLATIQPSFANDARSEAAAMIAARAPGDLDKVFFTNGGADANEHAVRMAKLPCGWSYNWQRILKSPPRWSITRSKGRTKSRPKTSTPRVCRTARLECRPRWTRQTTRFSS